MARGPKRAQKPSKPPRDENPFEDDDLDDEIDAFHKQRDVVPLDVDDDVDTDDDEEYPVLGIEDSADDDSDEDKNDEDDDIYDDKDIAKMKRQAKYMEQIVGGKDDLSDDAEPEKESQAVWGNKRSIYYERGGKEPESSDEEKSKAEEAEAVRLQKERLRFLRMGDIDLPSDSDLDQDDGDSAQEKTSQGILDGMKSMTTSVVDILREGDIKALSKEEQMDLVYKYAPELVPWLSELRDAHSELEKLNPFISKVEKKKNATRNAMHYLEVKHILLLAYCQAISCYLLLRLEGHDVRDHPVKARISEIQNLSEQMKQIEVNLPSQIEELLNCSPASDLQDKLVEESVLSEAKPDMTKLPANLCDVPPVNKATKLTNNQSGEFLSTLACQKHQDVVMSLQSKEMLKVRANLEAKLKQKGIYNLTTVKPERNRNHALKSVNMRLETFDDFADEVQQASRSIKDVRTSALNPTKLVAPKVKKPKFVSGDDDLPKRDDIGERRRKHELRVLAGAGPESMDINVQQDGEAPDDDNLFYNERKKQKTKKLEDGEDAEDDKLEDREDAEDDFYKEVKNQRTEKLQTKEKLYSRVSVFPPPLEAEEDGKRHITRQIDKNRGLTRSRKKETKTPRKNNRRKYEKAVKRNKGQVRAIKKPSGPYGGEQTGINASISHSRRF